MYRMAEIGRFLVSAIPPFISYPLAAGVGDVMYVVWPRARRNMVKSVANILNRDVGDREVRNIARHCMRNFCKYIVDMLRYSFAREDFFQKQFQITGQHNLDDALKEGKGVILVSFHVGNLDLGVRLLSSLGYPVNAVVNNLEWSGQMDAFLQKPRAFNGTRLINSRDTSMHLLDILRRNEILALMIDCPSCRRGVKVKLGQKWVTIPSGAATLALRTGARIIPCGLVRTSNTTFQGILGKPIECRLTGKIGDDTRDLTQCMVSALEEMTRSFVDQWYIFHPMIKDELQDNPDASEGNTALNPAG